MKTASKVLNNKFSILYHHTFALAWVLIFILHPYPWCKFSYYSIALGLNFHTSALPWVSICLSVMLRPMAG